MTFSIKNKSGSTVKMSPAVPVELLRFLMGEMGSGAPRLSDSDRVIVTDGGCNARELVRVRAQSARSLEYFVSDRCEILEDGDTRSFSIWDHVPVIHLTLQGPWSIPCGCFYYWGDHGAVRDKLVLVLRTKPADRPLPYGFFRVGNTELFGMWEVD